MAAAAAMKSLESLGEAALAAAQKVAESNPQAAAQLKSLGEAAIEMAKYCLQSSPEAVAKMKSLAGLVVGIFTDTVKNNPGILNGVKSFGGNTYGSFESAARENPSLAIILLVGAIGACLTAVAAPAVLAAIGFTSIGPAAGTLASAWQSAIGLVQAGSSFSFFQGAAMGGAAYGWFIAGASAVGGAVSAAAAGLADYFSRSRL